MRQIMVPLVVSLGLLAAACGGTATEQPQPTGERGTKPVASNPAAADEKGGDKTTAAGTGKRYALLVGCTRYDHLPASKHLRGPANDVKLMREVLTKKFRFADKDIVTLVEGSGAANRPTRANIKREFDRLSEKARKRDEVVILLSGHGSQQPDQEPFDEPDGLDEIFLPADAGPWNEAKEMVANAIVDDELGVWTKAIVDRGASLWLIADCCHSGTIIRDPVEFGREIFPEDLIPKAALEKARALAEKRRQNGTVPQQKPFELTGTHPRLVALYAAQAHEPTVERAPYDGSTTEPYGLLTYTMCEILTQAKSPLTYRELAQRIHTFYVQKNRTGPTPLVEGSDQDREVLGMTTWPGRSRFTLRQDQDAWKITGGGLHGLTEGSVLAVYPPAGQPNPDKPLGHVRIHKGDPVEAEVEPVAFGKLPAPKELPVGGRVELVSLDYGSFQLKVGVDYGDDRAGKKAGGELQRLEEELRKRAKGPTALFQVVARGQGADWVLQKRDGRIVLLPAAAAGRVGKLPADMPQFGPYTADVAQKLEEELGRIARAGNLLKLTKSVHDLGGNEGTRASASAVDIEVVMLKFKDRSDKKGQPVAWQRAGVTLVPGDRMGWLLKNRSRLAVDVSLLFVDSQFGIEAAWPNKRSQVTDNRLLPGQSVRIGPSPVTGDTIGLEHLVVIAVRADGPPIDFTCLAQPTLARAEQAVPRGAAKQTLGSPLGKLFQKALYAQGTARGLGREEIDNHELRLLSWRVVPQPKGKDKKGL